MEAGTMAANRMVFIVLLSIVCSSPIGIQASDNLPVKAKIKAESKSDENRQPQGSQGYPEGFTVKTEVDLVTADVTVLGTPGSELQADDFILFDNDVSQKIRYFSRDQLPLAIAILIDRSGSVTPYLTVLQIAGITALRRLKPEDQVALFAFDLRCEKLCDLTEDRLRIAEKIGEIRGGGGTNIYDSLFEAANYLKKKAPRRRHAIILISDNISRPYYYDARQCLVALLETGTTLYNIVLPSRMVNMDIQRLAGDTGGDVINVMGQESLKEALENAIVQLRMQYTLGFHPSDLGKPGSYHKLRVRFANKEGCPDCRLLVRGGYYAGVAAPLPLKEAASAIPRHSDQETDDLLVRRSMLIAGTAYLELDEIPFKVSIKEQTDSRDLPQIQLELKIDPEEVELSETGGAHACNIVVAIFYADGNGNGLGSDWWRIENRLNEHDYRQVMKTGIPFSIKVPFKVDNQILKIVVYDVRSDRLSSKLVKLGKKPPPTSSDEQMGNG
jgi:VWFA-related protein